MLGRKGRFLSPEGKNQFCRPPPQGPPLLGTKSLFKFMEMENRRGQAAKRGVPRCRSKKSRGLEDRS